MEPRVSPALCELCGEPMPPGEEMFKFHGYSGDCPGPPLPRRKPVKLIMECEAGHVSTLTIEGMDRVWAEEYGRTLDGTSAMYVNGPVTDSTWIGVCQHGRKQPANPNDQYPPESMEALKAQGGCGARFKCRVEGN